MSELESGQEADEQLDEGQEVVEAGQTPGAESATATGENQDNKQDGVQAAINRKHFQFKEEERRRLQAEQENAELRKRLEQSQKPGSVDIPPMPDPYDDDYEEKVRAREDAIMRKAQADADARVNQRLQEQEQERKREAEQERVKKLVGDFNTNATKLGLDLDQVTQASNIVGSYGVGQEVANFLLGDSAGPLMVQYLSSNPMALYEMVRMSPIQAALKLHGEVREKAKILKPQATEAPDPAKTLNGGGVPDTGRFPLTGGAKFE